MPCHLRAQNVGYKTRDVLALLPNTTVKVVEEWSGHDGTWAMKKETFEQSLKWGRRAFSEMAEGSPKVTCSDCPLAAIQIEQGNGRRPLIRCRFWQKAIVASRSVQFPKQIVTIS